MANGRVIAKIKGGIGNQLFSYAAALRLALVNGAELIIDNVSGFIDDPYKREYKLDKFNIRGRLADRNERLQAWGGYRSRFKKKINSFLPFNKRKYIAEDGLPFDPRLLDYKVKNTTYLDGYWQSERYFNDIEEEIRHDLRIAPPQDETNKELSAKIKRTNSVAIHVRWFNAPEDDHNNSNISGEYYDNSIHRIEKEVENPHYFIFSDQPESAADLLDLKQSAYTLVSHNKGKAYADLWLMSQCQHFIIANSTFSWWGAWLSTFDDKLVIAPSDNISGVGSWGFQGLIPDRWESI